MKIQKLPNNKGYLLTISEEVAGVLMAIFSRIGGDPANTPRGVIDCLRDLFRAAAGTKNYGAQFRNFPVESGGIYFEKCGIEKLQKEIAEAQTALEESAEIAAGAKVNVPCEFIIYAAVDLFGGKWSVVVDESGVIVQIYGLRTKTGETALFESEAYHLPDYCKQNGIQLAEFRKTEILTVAAAPPPPPVKQKRKKAK